MTRQRTQRLWLLILLAGCLLLAGCPAGAPSGGEAPGESPWQLGTPTPLFSPLDATCLGQQPAPVQLPGLRYGINLFLFGTDRARTLTLANIAQFNWVRQQIHWRDIEGEAGQFVWRPLDQIVNAARAHDQRLMLSIVRSPPRATVGGHSGLPADPHLFAAFMAKVAARYQGRVAAYEVWNEPNLSHENGGTPAQPAAYLALLEATYPAIKQADPCALVLSAPLAATNNPDPAVATDDVPFFEQLYELNNGAFLRVADAVAAHTGAGPHPPDAGWPVDQPELSHHYFRHIERLRAVMLRHGDPRQVWITEVGWTVTSAEGAPEPVTLEQQATYLQDMLWFVRQRYPWVAAVFVWNLNFSLIAPPEDEKTTYSLLNPDWSVRPAFVSLQHAVGALRDSERVPFVPAAASHRHVWTFPARGALRSTPLLGTDGMLYAMSDPATLYALDAKGVLRWTFTAPGMVRHAPVPGPDGMLYVADSVGIFSAVGENGAIAWTANLADHARGSPVYLAASGPDPDQTGDRIAIVTHLGKVYAFDPGGQERWTYDLGTETTPLVRTSDGALLVVDASGLATSLNPTGAVRWQTPLVGEFWAPPMPATDPNNPGGVYVVTVRGRVLALDGAGQVRWQRDLNVPVVAAPLAGTDGVIYIAARDGTLSALATTDGAVRWQVAMGSPLNAPPVQAPDGTLYLGTSDEMLLALDPGGQVRWRIQVKGIVDAPPTLAPDGTLYLPTTAGRLYAFGPEPPR